MRLSTGTTDQNMETALRQLTGEARKTSIEELLTTTPEKDAEPVEAEDQTLNPFAFGYFAGAMDKNGVHLALPEYVKRSCTVCYGRGYQVHTFGGRRYTPCRCVKNGYLRAAKQAAQACAAEAKRLARAQAAAQQ